MSPMPKTSRRHRRPRHKTASNCKAVRPTLSPNLGDAERNYVFAIAMKYVKDEEAANDVAQEALLLAHRHRNSFRGDSRYSTWLYRIAATTALMHLRKRRRKSRELLAMANADGELCMPGDGPCPALGPEDCLANRECVQLVEQRLAALGDKYIQIFWMRYLEGYTETEIARKLSLNLSTVKTRAHRAKVAVRQTLRAAA